MKLISLTKGKYAQVDDKDFEWLSQWKWCFDSRYACRAQWDREKKKCIMIRMHQLILRVPSGSEVDHIDRNKLNNQRDNLRALTHGENILNQGLSKRNTSGFKGAFYSKEDDLWYSTAKRNGKRFYLGVFKNAEEAGKAYMNFHI